MWTTRLSAVLVACGVFAVAASAQPSDRAADEAAIREVVAAYLGTREENDAAALRALLTEDVDQLVTSGALRLGREAVVEGSLASTRETGGRRSIRVETVRFLTDDVAIADGPYDIVGRTDGVDRHYRTTMVLVREDGRWKIAAIRNMQPAP
ncbi:MAG TPA: SgcJ/EcaC family oxidoreductase [Gammaproteobacteria bacterium]